MIIDDLLDLWVLHWYIYIYPLVMTNVAIEHRPFLRTVKNNYFYEPSKNSMAMLVIARWYIYIYIHYIYTH